jgi:NitT/TauT family transport system substrate-binding protein
MQNRHEERDDASRECRGEGTMSISTGINRRTFLGTTFAGAAGVVLLGGCGSQQSTAGSTQGGAGSYSGQLSVPLYTELPDNAVFIVGFEKGIFDREKLGLKPVNFLQGSDVIRSVVSSSHLGVSSPISGMVASASGLSQIRIFGTCLATLTIYFMVKPDSPIRSPADLKGKKIGINAPTSITTYAGIKMVESSGLNPKTDVDLIDVDSAAEAATALENGIVDCTWSSPPLSVQLVQEGKMRQLVDAATLLPGFIQSALFTTTSFLQSNPSVIQRFVEATDTAQTFIREHTEEAAHIWAAKLGITPAVALGTLQKIAPAYRIGVSQTGFELNVEACRQLGLLKQPISYNDMVVDKYAGV